MRSFLAQAAVIARRDFLATVFTPAFLVFLLAPAFMLLFATVGGTGARMIADSGEASQRVVVIADAGYASRIEAADERLRPLFQGPMAPPTLEKRTPAEDPEEQARTLFDDDSIDVNAVLYGGMDEQAIITGPGGAQSGDYLAMLADQAARDMRAGTGTEPIAEIERVELDRTSATIGGRQTTGTFALFTLFLLTLLLAGQTVSVLAEEKGNKVIEILAAAVPLEAVFFGKLVGLFGVAVLFVTLWGGLVAFAFSAMAGSGDALSSIAPAIGFGPFIALCFAYFAMAYMLLGAMFLAFGAQASSMREIQMLSLPITFFQMAMFGLAGAAVANPGSQLAFFAELFPYSSPFAMAARGATDTVFWPHFAALAWQALWVTITIAIGARMFRKGVLKSGPSLARRFTNILRNGTIND